MSLAASHLLLPLRRSIPGLRPRWAVVGMLAAAFAVLVLTDRSSALPSPVMRQQVDVALESAQDGRDHREEAFALLIEQIRREGGALAGTTAPMPSAQVLLDTPELFRGRRMVVRGVLLQRSRLSRPFAHVEEWFLRHEDGTPLMLFVVEADPEHISPPLTAGTLVETSARFYKRIDAVARDGEVRGYAAFATDAQLVRAVRLADPALRRTGPMIALIIAIVPVLLVLRLLVRRSFAHRSSARGAGLSVEEEDLSSLPEDPAEALEELRRRAQENGT